MREGRSCRLWGCYGSKDTKWRGESSFPAEEDELGCRRTPGSGSGIGWREVGRRLEERTSAFTLTPVDTR